MGLGLYSDPSLPYHVPGFKEFLLLFFYELGRTNKFLLLILIVLKRS
jgi:hypothetical protein